MDIIKIIIILIIKEDTINCYLVIHNDVKSQSEGNDEDKEDNKYATKRGEDVIKHNYIKPCAKKKNIYSLSPLYNKNTSTYT